METTTTSGLDDLKATLEALELGKTIPLDVDRRIQERSEEVRKRLPKTEVAVDLIRDARK